MHRKRLLDLLSNYQPFDSIEEQMYEKIIMFVQENENCFERSLLEGHVTGSAWILDGSRQYALLVHHRKLDRWFQPGGHCDGDSDVQRVAFKEATEETGLPVKPLHNQIFDIDIHLIPERPNEPAHYHYDVRFLFEAKQSDTLVVSAESKELAWIHLDNILTYNQEPSIARMITKTPLFKREDPWT
jgi:8-oxo-dGTP pyrophosphatase MutT (NUDIX family)